MSADNAVYIRPMSDGLYAVKLISSLYTEVMSDDEIDKEFLHAPKFVSLEAAWAEDERIQDEAELEGTYIEYGTEILERQPHVTDTTP